MFRESDFESLLKDIILFSTKKSMETSELKISLGNEKSGELFAITFPVIAATWDMTSKDDINRYLIMNCGEAVERVLDSYPDAHIDLMIERNKLYLINFLRHELAGRYVLSKFGKFKNQDLESLIKNMSIMKDYNLDLFSQSTEPHYRYTTPQLVKSSFKSDDKTLTKYSYMGLQKHAKPEEKDESFFREVQACDLAYESVSSALDLVAKDIHKWYNVKFTPKTVSSLITSSSDPDQPGGPQ